jgi:hypothetical protein
VNQEGRAVDSGTFHFAPRLLRLFERLLWRRSGAGNIADVGFQRGPNSNPINSGEFQ